MRQFGWPAIVACLVLVGCAQQEVTSDSQPRMDLPQNCGAEDWKKFIGQPLTAIDRTKLTKGARFIGPVTAITADYNPERLNIEHDDDDIIRGVSCY